MAPPPTDVATTLSVRITGGTLAITHILFTDRPSGKENVLVDNLRKAMSKWIYPGRAKSAFLHLHYMSMVQHIQMLIWYTHRAQESMYCMLLTRQGHINRVNMLISKLLFGNSHSWQGTHHLVGLHISIARVYSWGLAQSSLDYVPSTQRLNHKAMFPQEGNLLLTQLWPCANYLPHWHVRAFTMFCGPANSLFCNAQQRDKDTSHVWKGL